MTEVKLETLKELIQCQESPCISIYMSTEAVHRGEFKKLKIGFKNLLQEVEQKLKENWGFKQRQIDKLLASPKKLVEDNSFWQEQKEGLAVFVSEKRFDYYKLSVDIYDKTHLSSNFNIKQLITEIYDNQKYYLLALSPNYNQLYRGTRNELEKLEVEELPTNIKEYLNLDAEAAEKYQSISSAGASTFFHGQGAAADDDNEDLIRYLKEIDRVIKLKLKEDSPLLIAGDDNLFSLYKKINTYDNLLSNNLSGNAKDMNKNKLQEKAWKIIQPSLAADLNEDKARYLELQAGNQSGAGLEEVIEAAHHGKIDILFLNKKAEKNGVFNKDEHEIEFKENNEDYDLYNFAVFETILKGGEVHSLEKEKMPGEEDIAAIYRY